MAQPAPAAAVARLGHGFVAGFLATLVFHQSGLALLHRVGLFGGCGRYRPLACRQ
jgi:hypothetical protein